MLNRHIYWADASRGKIERASYEGQERQLIAEGLSLPTAIVLDLDNSLIYWNEYGASVIKEAKLDGTEARVIASPVQSLAMTILGNYIYWTDNVKNYTGRVNRFTRSEFSPVLLRERFMGIRILQDISDCIQSPCQNGGSCLPEMNGYKCQCVFGFTGTNCETALQQCGISPCLHNSICVVVGSNPRCICQDGCYGDICQYDTLLITHLAPNVGPIAGGTKITLIGEEFPASDARITIGDVASCNTLTSNSTTIIAITPPVIQKYAEKERQIFVQFPGLDLNFSTEYNFTFKADPKVTSVYPLETIEKGGTRLTVAGDHFDSVEKPLLKVDKVDQTIEISGNTTSVINETITTYYEECTRLSVILLICITPDIDVSDTTIFLNRRRRDVISERANLYQLEGFDSWKVLRARRKRETRLETRQLLYIGIILDGVNRFKNLSANHNTRIYGRLTLISPPEFSGSTKNELFQFHRGEPLDIKGSDIDKLSIDDYTIDVGSTRCSVISITKNSLHCMPPQKEPPKDKRSPPKGHLIVVHIGTRVQKPVGILEYPFNRLLYIGIGVAVVVVFVFIVITILVCLRQRNTKRRNVRGREGVISVINLPPVLPEYSPETRRRIPNTTMDMSPISPVPEHDVITSGNHNYVSVYRPPEHVYQALMTSTFNRSSETETEDNIYQGLPQTNKLNKRRQVTSQYPE